jgi:outer membrane protein assembly factor BamD (BamD/ComL family)
MAKARRALSRKEHARAFRILAAHAREFPEGAMQEDRLALEVVALCGSGRVDEGRAATRTFLARFPQSIHAGRVAEACDEDEDASTP